MARTFLGIFLLLVSLLTADQIEACTIAVISGRFTVDGRPLLWKNRDYASAPHNEVVLFEDGDFRVVAVVTAGKHASTWMGTNSAGLCILNSLSNDLDEEGKESGLGNGSLMKRLLQNCATLEDVRQELSQLNTEGRATRANLGMIDATGGAAMVEVGPSKFEWFDANDPDTAPRGYLVRSNFSVTGQEHLQSPMPSSEAVEPLSSGRRYLRACRLLEQQRPRAFGVDFLIQNATRDLADVAGEAISGSVNALEGHLPPFIDTQQTISRSTTVSAAVFHGVRTGEDPRLTTMWVQLGDPKFSVAVPCWATMQSVADPLAGKYGGEIGEIARTLRDNCLESGGQRIQSKGLPGIWEDLLPLEESMIRETRERRSQWVAKGIDQQELSAWHQLCADRAYAAMKQELVQAKQAAIHVSASDRVEAEQLGIAIDASGENKATEQAAHRQAIRVAIYDHSDGSANGPKNLLRFLTVAQGFAAQRVRPEDIQQGCLKNFDVLVVPGGSGSSQSRHLDELGREAIIDFVDTGGGYVGICAGSYLASSHYSWSLGLINARVWDRAHWARGTGQVNLEMTDAGCSALAFPESETRVYYGQGPLLVPDQQDQLPDYEVLATYGTAIAAKGAESDAMTETHAIVRAPYGQGRVMCFSPHPETSSGPNSLISNGIRWVAGRNNPTMPKALSPAEHP